MSDSKLIQLTKYLIGLTQKNNHSIVWDHTRKTCVPVVVSPMAEYLNEVNRFLFSGGLNVDVQDADSDDPRQIFIDTIVTKNKFQSSLESIWETGAITGQLLCVLRLTSSNYYSFEWFDGEEFETTYSDGELTEVCVRALRVIDGKTYVYKLKLTPGFIIEYPLVEERYERNTNWEAIAEPKAHNYNCIPAVVIKNRVSINSNHGVPEFNFAACKIAAATMLTTFNGVENVYLFGSPVLASPDPDDTLKRIKARIQVYTKEPNEDGGGVDVLNFNPISETHLNLVDKLTANFNRFMGIKPTDGTGVNVADASSLTLRMLNSATISKAEERWQSYVSDGIKPLFELCLRMGAVDGILAMVNVADTSTYTVQISRKKPYFAESPQETMQQLTVAQQLVDLGVDRVQALKETVWPNLTLEQIESKLRVNLEDV